MNLSSSADAIAIVARNDANEQEHVELHDAPGAASGEDSAAACVSGSTNR